MASFTDRTPTFNPYVAQLPVDAMAKVGMQKQAQYDAGYQKIQGSIDRVAGMDIAKDVDQQYVQGKLDTLGNDLRTVAAGDFSNFQLTNSIAGMTSDIVDDENVQNAVSSTFRLRQENNRVAADRKKGTLTPDNAYDYAKQVNDYMSDEEVGASFDGEYSPHFDVFKFAKDTFDEILPDGMTYDQVFVLDGEGNPVKDKKGNFIYAPAMTRIMKKGRFPAKVKATIDQIFSDPRVAKQLNITGKYNYRGVSGEDISQKISQQKTMVLEAMNAEKDKLTIDLSTGADVQGQIDDINAGIIKTNVFYEDLQDTARQDPDRLRGMLYTDEVSSRYTKMFGQISTEQKVMENPYWTAQFKQQQELNKLSMWAQEFQRDLRNDAQDQLNWKAEYAQENYKIAQDALNAANEGKDEDGITTGFGPVGSTPRQDFQSNKLDPVTGQEIEYENAVNELTSANQELIWENLLSKNPANVVKLQEVQLSGKLTREQGIKMLIQQEALKTRPDVTDEGEMQKVVDLWTTNTLNTTILRGNNMTMEEKEESPMFTSLLRRQEQAKKEFTSQDNFKNLVDEAMLREYEDAADDANFEDIKPQTFVFRDKEYNLSKRDIIDLAIVKRGTRNKSLTFLENETAKKAANKAYERLQESGNAELYTAMSRDHLWEGLGYPVSFLEQFVKDNPVSVLYRAFRWESERFPILDGSRDWEQVDNVLDKVENEESLKRLERKAELINEIYHILPNQTIDLLGGKVEKNNETINKLGAIAANYVRNDQNASATFKEFAKSINTINKDKGMVTAGIVIDSQGRPVVEARAFDENNNPTGVMRMTNEEAASINIDPTILYDSKETRTLRLAISAGAVPGQTSVGDPKHEATYKQGDAYFSKGDYPALKDHPADVKVNIKRGPDGKYYPFIYINDGKTQPFVKELNGTTNLGMLLNNLNSKMTPRFINSFLTKQYADARAREANQ